MVADVPLGALLSGGYDSSLVVALIAGAEARGRADVHDRLEDSRMDESIYARGVAEHLGTALQSCAWTTRRRLKVVPRLATIYDEPFGDSSQIPTFLVMQLARRT